MILFPCFNNPLKQSEPKKAAKKSAKKKDLDSSEDEEKADRPVGKPTKAKPKKVWHI